MIGEWKRHDQPQILESGHRRLRRTTLPQPRQTLLESELRYITLLGKQTPASVARLTHRQQNSPLSSVHSSLPHRLTKTHPDFSQPSPPTPIPNLLVVHSCLSRLSPMDGGFGGHANYEHHDLGSLQQNPMSVFQEGDIREFVGASEKLLIR